MATSRIFYRNLLTQATFSGFNVAGGAVSMATSGWSSYYPYAAGKVTFEIRGTYTGNFELDYVVEIHISSDGTFANSRWRWSDDGGANWNVSNITPVSGTWVTLNNGLEVRFVNSGTTPQFVLGDYRAARAIRPYGIVKALDGSRNTEYRSGTTPANSTVRVGWDLGTAQQPGLFVLDDHNIPATGVATLYAHATTLFTESGGFSQVCTWRANRIAELITSSAFRYWWIKIAMPSSGQPSYLRFSEMFLGTGDTFTLPPSIGMSYDEQWLGSFDVPNVATRGPSPRIYSAAISQRTWELRKRDVTEDGGKLEAAHAYAKNHASYTLPPFWFIPLDSDLSNVEYNSWAGDLTRHHRFMDRWDYQTQWAQVIRTVAS